MFSSPLTVQILILSVTCEDINVVIITMIANRVRFDTHTRNQIYQNGCRARHVLVFKTATSHYWRNNTHLKDLEWKEKALKNTPMPL